MEGRPKFIPPSPEEKKNEMDERYAKHFACLRERTANAKKKVEDSAKKPAITTAQPPALDEKQKASGESGGEDDKQLVRNEQGDLVLKKYLDL